MPPGPADPLGDALRALSPSLARFFERRAGRGAAEDLVQEAAYRVEKLRRQYDPARPAEPWIWRIARLTLLEHLRARVRTEPLDGASETPEREDAALLDRARADHEETVWTAIRELPDDPRSRSRTAVTLHALEGITHARLATEFGIGESASKMRVARGLDALEAILARGRSGWSAARRDAAAAAWAFVRRHEGQAERTAILAVWGRIEKGLRGGLGLANEPIDEVQVARQDEALRAAGWPYP